jgi:glutathione synthase
MFIEIEQIVIRAAVHFVWVQVVTYAPFTLFPSPVPKDTFHRALAVQTHYNRLVDKISQAGERSSQVIQRAV